MECEHFFDKNSTVCCKHYKFGFKYSNNRMLQIDKMSRRCEKNNIKTPSKFAGPITEDMVSQFEEIYKNTSKSVRKLQIENRIYSKKWYQLASEVNKKTGYVRPNIYSVREDRYIIERKGAKRTYYLVKHNNEHYGYYHTKKMAILVRNLLEENDWNKEMLDVIKSEAAEKLNHMF